MVWRQWHPTPVLLPGKSHGRRSLVSCSSWGRWESDTTERLHFEFSLSCIGEGNGNPLQCSCLENPRDGEPGGLPSMGSHRVRYDWSDLAAAASCSNFPVGFKQKCGVGRLQLNWGLESPFRDSLTDVSFYSGTVFPGGVNSAWSRSPSGWGMHARSLAKGKQTPAPGCLYQLSNVNKNSKNKIKNF